MKNRIRLILLTLLVAALFFFSVDKRILPGFSSSFSPEKSTGLLERVIRLIKNDYVEERNPAEIMEGAFKGLVNSLDSYSAYLNKENTAKYLQQKTASLREPGLIAAKFIIFPMVVGFVDNSSAEKAGILIGDYITEIDNISTTAMSLLEVNLILKNIEEKPVQLKILRDNDTHEFIVERSLLSSETVSFSTETAGLGILKVNTLNPPCVREIKKKHLDVLKKRTGPLVLDLRNCHEGTLEESLSFINLFLKAERIGSLEKKGGVKESLSCPDEPELEHTPLAVWINQATIGFPEMVAGVLKEFQRGPIIGLPTSGLVAKSEFFPLRDGTSLILTSGILSLRSGEKLWMKGVKPDVDLTSQSQDTSSYLKETFSFFSVH